MCVFLGFLLGDQDISHHISPWKKERKTTSTQKTTPICWQGSISEIPRGSCLDGCRVFVFSPPPKKKKTIRRKKTFFGGMYM